MARDPEGHLISPKLRADQQEVNSLYAQLPTHAEQGKQELERLFASGHERRDAGQTAEARERFVAAYLLARELTFAAGEAEALTLVATCTLELGELPLTLTRTPTLPLTLARRASPNPSRVSSP